ncbi:MAG: tRNA (cytidine(34)-2'-O)-methyltransferase [Actinomycetia bacterium]|nr:tRNA (cytidine(34)-2'-O)-methyltransferase [Actinomycetes bacterium]
MHVVLVAPSIAPNTGNIIRLCANTGVDLHLVEPLGFEMDAYRLRRAGLDYHDMTNVVVHTCLDNARLLLRGRWMAFTSSGSTRYTDIEYTTDDVLVFGNETTGLADDVLTSFDESTKVSIPMMPANRSLNLANAVSIVVYEAWRQNGFAGSA